MCALRDVKGQKERVGFGGCVVLSGAVIRFINAGITSRRDSSSLLVLTHSVTSFLWRATGSASVSLSFHLPLSFPGSRRLSVSQKTLSPFVLSPSFLFLPRRLCLHPSLPCVLDSFASSVSLLFTFVPLFVSLCHSPLSACVQTSKAVSDRSPAAASQGYAKHEMRKEVSG